MLLRLIKWRADHRTPTIDALLIVVALSALFVALLAIVATVRARARGQTVERRDDEPSGQG